MTDSPTGAAILPRVVPLPWVVAGTLVLGIGYAEMRLSLAATAARVDVIEREIKPLAHDIAVIRTKLDAIYELMREERRREPR